ncbi:MAG: hypothetical protein V3S30_05605 [Thermoanaerobaculia bacterium]
MQVTTRRGRAISNAEVTIVYKGEEQDVGPGPVETDNKGKAVFSGLRAGLWQIEVVHDDYLSYVASIQIRHDKKPTVQASFLQAGGKSLVPLKVKFFRVTNESASPSIGPPLVAAAIEPEKMPDPTPEPPPKPAQQPQEPQSAAVASSDTPVTSASQLPPGRPILEAPTPPVDRPGKSVVTATQPTPAENQSPPTQVATSLREAPLDEPETAIEPTSEIETEPPTPPTAPTPTQQAVPESPPPEAPLKPAESVLPNDEKPQPALPSVQEPPVQPANEIVSPLSPADPPSSLVSPELAALSGKLAPPDPIGSALRSNQQQTCPECKSYEWAASSEQVTGVGSADATCPDSFQAAAHQAMNFLATSVNLELLSFAGPVADGTQNDAALLLEPEKLVAFESLQGDDWNPLASCRVVAVVLPKASRFVGFRYEAVDGGSSGTCLPATECEIGQSYWTGHAEVLRGRSATIVYGFFVNQSRERRRRARLTAYFAPNSSEWVPSTTP